MDRRHTGVDTLPAEDLPLPAAGRRPLAWLVTAVVRAYRKLLSPLLPPACRFHPSCSHYALVALSTHRLPRALLLIVTRLLRCQPLCRGGTDWPPPGPLGPIVPRSGL